MKLEEELSSMAVLKFSQGKAGLIEDNKTFDFKELVFLKYLKVIVGLKGQFKHSTSDFTWITKPSYIKEARFFQNHSDF